MAGAYKSLLVLLIVGMIQREAIASQHVVGGSNGWDQSTDFDTWAKAKTFKVGDTLEFKYTPGLHSVVELADSSAYESCDLGSPLKSMNGGNNVVKLDEAGTRYYACGTPGHCDAGMKVKITIVSADGTPGSSSTTPSKTPSSTTSSARNVHFFVSFYVIVALLGNMVFFM